MVFSDQRKHAIAFSNCFVDHNAREFVRLVEKRLIAPSPFLPVAAMALIDDEV